MERVARNYAKLRGECAFEAQNVTSCAAEGGKKKECQRYAQQFKRWVRSLLECGRKLTSPLCQVPAR